MKTKARFVTAAMTAAIWGAGAMPARAQAPAPAAAPTAPAAAPAAPAESAEALLRRVDKQSNAFNDARFKFKMRIKEPGSTAAREVEFTTIQKGKDRRLVRFTAPGDIKGMGFLVEPTAMYVKLPAFGNKVRRLGTSSMNQSFMGSDLASDDMAAIEIAPLFDAKFLDPESGNTVLALTLKSGKQAEFPRQKMWVNAQNATIVKIEYMDASGKKLRTQKRLDYTQDGQSPDHFSPGKMVFTDHRRNDHETELLLLESKLNLGLGDDLFTPRALERSE